MAALWELAQRSTVDTPIGLLCCNNQNGLNVLWRSIQRGHLIWCTFNVPAFGGGGSNCRKNIWERFRVVHTACMYCVHVKTDLSWGFNRQLMFCLFAALKVGLPTFDVLVSVKNDGVHEVFFVCQRAQSSKTCWGYQRSKMLRNRTLTMQHSQRRWTKSVLPPPRSAAQIYFSNVAVKPLCESVLLRI